MSLRSFTIYDIFGRNALLTPDAPAVVDPDGERITFKKLLEDVDALAVGLSDKGIAAGDRIGVLALNHPRFFTLMGAAAALGAIVVPVNWRLSEEEIRYILQDCVPKILVADTAQMSRAADTAPEETEICAFDASGGGSAPTLDSLMNGNGLLALASVMADDPFCIIYTAAVEGKPRGAMLSHGNLSVNNIQLAARLGITPADAYLNMLPLFHITGLNLALSTLHVGGKNVVIEKFDEKRTLALTQQEKISLLGSFPPILSRLTAQMEKEQYDVSSLRHVLGLDGPDNIRPFEEKTGATFWILYGQTETTGLVTFSPAMEKPGSAGQPGYLMKMRLVDDADNEVGPGETGEIAVQGLLVFSGYWGQDALNERTFRNDWHHTGDLGRIDEEGYLFFAGRKPEKELIKPGGENVYPAEVEEVILQCPDVVSTSVIGVPDPQFGEGIKAVCTLKPGSSLKEEDLIEFVAARIARYKKPRYVQFVKELPVKPDGAVDRNRVKELYGGNP